MSTANTIPAAVSHETTDSRVYGIDFTARASSTGITPSSPTVTLTGGPYNTPVSLADAPQINGMVVLQKIRAGVLQPGTYQMRIVVVDSADSTLQETAILEVVCQL